MDEEFSINLINNILELYIFPEIEKRQESHQIPKPFTLKMAQVVLPPLSQKNIEIRLNEEVSAVASIKLKNGIGKEKGDPVLSTEVAEIVGVEFTEDDNPNNAHIFLANIEKKWFLYYDFRYNKSIVKDHISRADEFLNTAEFSKTKQYWGSFIENLFGASELLQKSFLLIFANEIAMQASSHGPIRSQFYLYLKNTKINADFSKTIKELDKLRGPARYLKGELRISEEMAEKMLTDIILMREEAKKLIS
jgi:hypothetical protein